MACLGHRTASIAGVIANLEWALHLTENYCFWKPRDDIVEVGRCVDRWRSYVYKTPHLGHHWTSHSSGRTAVDQARPNNKLLCRQNSKRASGWLMLSLNRQTMAAKERWSGAERRLTGSQMQGHTREQQAGGRTDGRAQLLWRQHNSHASSADEMQNAKKQHCKKRKQRRRERRTTTVLWQASHLDCRTFFSYFWTPSEQDQKCLKYHKNIFC